MKPKCKYERDLIGVIRSLTSRAEIRRTNSGHIKVTFKGAKRKATVVLGGSPSCRRARRNAIADMRKAMMLCEIETKEA